MADKVWYISLSVLPMKFTLNIVDLTLLQNK